VERLIIFAPNWLGDAVMALPAIGDVRRGAPAAAITIVAQNSVAPLFDMVRDVDEVIADRDHDLLATLKNTPTRFDTAILLPNSFRSALMARRAGIPERWGFRTDLRGPLLTRAIDRAPASTHQVDRYRHLVRALGFPSSATGPQLEVPADLRATADRILRHAGWNGAAPLVALAPGAAYGGSKRWPPDRFAALSRPLMDEGFQVFMIGSTADAPTGRAVETSLGHSSVVLNLIGRTSLPELAGVLSFARALISNDSGAMHLGAALGVPVTAVFGPTDERLHAPRPPSNAPSPDVVVLTHSVWCRPCYLRTCPIDHRCMRGIQTEAVLDAVRRMP
jgi:heptosyltransferase-2